MNETQQEQPQHRRIAWLKSAGTFALGVWGFATYLAVLGGIAWLATLAGPNAKAVAGLAVLGSTSFNILVLGAIERCDRD